jgi:hypothetical protein
VSPSLIFWSIVVTSVCVAAGFALTQLLEERYDLRRRERPRVTNADLRKATEKLFDEDRYRRAAMAADRPRATVSWRAKWFRVQHGIGVEPVEFTTVDSPLTGFEEAWDEWVKRIQAFCSRGVL